MSLHFLHFLLPAALVGSLVALCAPLLTGRKFVFYDACTQAGINTLAGMAMLGLGLWYFGSDGKLASYAALVVACASAQWWGSRG
ncbi:MAG: hypothetical protein ACT4NV_01135 [Rhodoferax sp.]